MLYVLFDEESTWKNLLPLTFTRPVSEIRLGILSIKQRWDLTLGANCQYYTPDYLATKYINPEPDADALFINSCTFPSPELVKALDKLQHGEGISSGGMLLAFRGNAKMLKNAFPVSKTDFGQPIMLVNHVWDIFLKNAEAIQRDFELLTKNQKSQAISSTVTVIGDKSRLFIAEGARVEASIINCKDGPVYIGPHAEIMEGCMIRGPFVLGEHSALKMGTKIYGATTIGPYCKVGGEVNNSIFFGYSNKAHDGFLGNSVIGEWCNLGADTNNSNLKNNYANVKLYSYLHQKPVDTGLQFCGLIMGDHSKSGINTMFNTGTVVGVACNIFGGGFPDTHIPNFSWGGSEGFVTYKPFKFFEAAERVYERRGLKLSQTDKDILTTVFAITNA